MLHVKDAALVRKMELTKVNAIVEVEFLCADNMTELIKAGKTEEAKEKVREYLNNNMLVGKCIKDIQLSIEAPVADKNDNEQI